MRVAFGVGARVMFRGSVERDAECIHLGASASRRHTRPDVLPEICFWIACLFCIWVHALRRLACPFIRRSYMFCAVRLRAPRSSTCLGARRPARHAPAAPTRRALPVAQSIRLAFRLHSLAPKVAGPDHRCWRLLSLTPRRGRSIRLRAPTSRAGGHRRVLPRCFDVRGVEEVPGEVGAQRELEAAHGRQRRGLSPRL